MIYKWIATLCVVTFFSFKPSCEIVECLSVEEMLCHIPCESVVLFELDDIILKNKELVAQKRFFETLKKEFLRRDYDLDETIDIIYPIWNRTQESSTLEEVDPSMLSAFSTLKKSSCSILGLTHRGERLAFQTLDFLEKSKINFDHLLDREIIYFDCDLASYHRGVLFVHPVAPKGEYLAKAISQMQFTPKHIVCVDNNLMELIGLQNEAQKLNIPFTGVYFVMHQTPLSDLEVKVAKTQLKYLDGILPDDKAQVLLDANGIEIYQ